MAYNGMMPMPNVNVQPFVNQLVRQRENVDNLLSQYTQMQQQPPVQNIINTNSSIEMEAKYLKKGEEVENILVTNKTLFIDEFNKKIQIKDVDGSISKTYEIIVPKDEKDLKIEELENKIKELSNKTQQQPQMDELFKKISEMEEKLNAFHSYTAYFDRTISRNVIRELEPINIKEQVNTFYKNIQNDIQRAHIDMSEPVFEGKGLITIPMHPSEWMSILFNLYTNAKKAMKDDRRLLIRCWKADGNVYLQFSDTGKGIPEEDWDNIFNAFFTTSSPVGRGSDSYTGTGLGLTIIREIVTSYSGEIKVVAPYLDYKTTFQISIPAN